MLCLEVAVNGERYCLAGADDVGFVFADVASRWPIQRLFRSGFDLSVRSWRRDGSIHWGERARHVNVGDVVTIRLVESNVPDSPRYCESSAFVDGVVAEPELFAYSTRIPDGLARFLFWMAVAIFGHRVVVCQTASLEQEADVVCLEVAVNGERYCVAAPNALSTLNASTMQFVDRHGLDRATGDLSVHGFSADFKTDLTWGGGARQLAVGDTVTIRVLKADKADPPERSQSGVSVEPVFRFGDLLRNSAGRSLLFWVAMTILGLIVWFVSSHSTT